MWKSDRPWKSTSSSRCRSSSATRTPRRRPCRSPIAKGETAMTTPVSIQRKPTRAVRIGSVTIGGGHPIAVQSMTATHTQDIAATVQQVNELHAAGADVVRIAVDSARDAEALAEIRRQTSANLAVDLQEN